MRRRGKGIVALGCGLVVWAAGAAWGGWSAGGRIAADSNVTRTVDGGTSDQYLWGFLSFTGGGTGQERLDWAWTATADGAAYVDVSDFDYVALTLTPELRYHLSPTWTASVAPFGTLKGVQDSDQSAVTFGVKLSLAQQLTERFYAGEHYIFTDNRARGDAFSYTENAVGAYLGASWTPRLWTEIGYDYARGDSFRTVDLPATAGSPGRGGGMGGRHGRAFGFDLVRETVDSHVVSATVGWNLSRTVTPYAGYTYRVTEGDLGTATSHIGYLGLTYAY